MYLELIRISVLLRDMPSALLNITSYESCTMNLRDISERKAFEQEYKNINYIHWPSEDDNFIARKT